MAFRTNFDYLRDELNDHYDLINPEVSSVILRSISAIEAIDEDTHFRIISHLIEQLSRGMNDTIVIMGFEPSLESSICWPIFEEFIRQNRQNNEENPREEEPLEQPLPPRVSNNFRDVDQFMQMF